MVKKESREVRNKMVVVRMNEKEYERLEIFLKKTTCRNTSEYLRKVSLQEPVTIKYRNQSADDFLAEMIRLKNELNAIGNNFNQAVHRLHTLDKIPEFRSWIMLYENTRQQAETKVSEILLRVTKMYNEWSQK